MEKCLDFALFIGIIREFLRHFDRYIYPRIGLMYEYLNIAI